MSDQATARRPAWDEVQERQRRARERLDAQHAAMNAADPDRPTDTWRVSGRPVTTPRPWLDPALASRL